MKKLIVLSVIFALVAVGVFAADVSVEVHGSANLISGSTGNTANSYDEYGQQKVDKDGNLEFTTPDARASFGIGRVRIGVSGGTEDGTLGGWGRLDFSGSASGAGFVWWKPVDMFKLQIGQNPDGEFGLDGIARWGFYQLAGEVVVSPNNAWGGSYTGLGANFGDAFFGGYGGAGLILNITPAEALAINIGIPLDGLAEEAYQKFTAQVAYDIEGVGKAGLTFASNLGFVGGKLPLYGYDEEDEKVQLVRPAAKPSFNPSQLYAYFNLSSVENLGIDLGIGYKLPLSGVTVVSGTGTNTETTTVSQNYPLAVGLGVSFSSGSFGVKTRILGEFLGSQPQTEIVNAAGTTKSEELSSGYSILFDVLPYFAINDNFTFYFSAGIGVIGGAEYMDGKDKVAEDAIVAWHVEPYISITPSYWSGTFFAGIRLESSIYRDCAGLPDKSDPEKFLGAQYINWSIPIGITVSF
jgi:opacity protein-like surface antigen